MEGYPAPNRDGNSAVESGRAHQLDDVVVRCVNDRHQIDGQDFVTGSEPAVEIGRSARNYVPDRDLRPFFRAADDAEAETRFVPQERHVHFHPLAGRRQRLLTQRRIDCWIASSTSTYSSATATAAAVDAVGTRPPHRHIRTAASRHAGRIRRQFVIEAGAFFERGKRARPSILTEEVVAAVAIVVAVTHNHRLRLSAVAGILTVELAQVLFRIIRNVRSIHS